MIVFPVAVHTLDDPNPETETTVHTLDDPSPETETTLHTLDDPSPETETTASIPLLRKGPRIIGGRPAFLGQFPYQVLLLLSHQTYR